MFCSAQSLLHALCSRIISSGAWGNHMIELGSALCKASSAFLTIFSPFTFVLLERQVPKPQR